MKKGGQDCFWYGYRFYAPWRGLGQIKEGYFADIIAVDRNPDENIKAFRSIDFVMVNGNIAKND